MALREFAGEVSRVLADPRGWRKYGYEFREVPAGAGVRRVRLETAERSAELCGVGGFSCWRRGPNDIIINLKNWMGGSASRLPLDRYRTYVVNHETGHSLGLSHQGCPVAECARRGLKPCPASVMQQMTRGPEHVAPCVEADWPLDPDWRIDDPLGCASRPRRRLQWVALALALLLVLLACVIAAVARSRSRRARIRPGRKKGPSSGAPGAFPRAAPGAQIRW